MQEIQLVYLGYYYWVIKSPKGHELSQRHRFDESWRVKEWANDYISSFPRVTLKLINYDQFEVDRKNDRERER